MSDRNQKVESTLRPLRKQREIGPRRQQRDNEPRVPSSEVEFAGSEVLSAAKDITAKEQDPAKLAYLLDEAERREASLRKALDDREKSLKTSQLRIAKLDKSLSKRDQQLSTLKKSLKQNAAKIAELTAALSQAKVELSGAVAAAKKHEDHARHIESVQRALTHDAQLSQAKLIVHFQSSTSWKVTRPLRALKLLLSQARSKLASLGLSPKPRAGSADDSTLIRQSGLFDEQYYLAQTRDPRIHDPIAHYLVHGYKEGLNPNPLFDAHYYATLYMSHLERASNPLVHFVRAGSGQSFDPSRLFETSFYLRSNPSLQSGATALLHYLKIGRLEGRLPADIPISDLNPLALELHCLDLTRATSDRFHPTLYAELYPEIANAFGATEIALRDHYETRGRAEGRIGSLAAFLKDLNMPPEAVPINFNHSEYYEINVDLGRALPPTFVHAVRHYLQHGIFERRRYSYSQCYIKTPKSRPSTQHSIVAVDRVDKAQKAACLVHVYYPELWPDLHRYIRNLDCVSRDVLINITDSMWSEALTSQIRQDVPDARIVISENRGRDIGGHLNSLHGVRIDDYSAFFLIHTKKSKHLSDKYSENWRNGLLEPLLGTQESVTQNLALLRSDPKVGIIGAAAWRHTGIDRNAKHYFYLLSKFGIDPAAAACDYVSGTMMIARPSIVRRMYDVLSKETFENADGRSESWLRDGQLEHAAERLFGDVCKSLGYKIHWC